MGGELDSSTAATALDSSGGPSIGQRVAAIVAFVTLAAALVVVVFGARVGWRDLLFATVGLVTAVAASWMALRHRGARRVVAAAGAALGLLAFAAGVVAAGMSGFRMGLAAAFAAIAVTSARVALQRSDGAMRRAAMAQPRVPPARSPALVINPASGGAKAERLGLVDECRARGIEPIVLVPGGDPVALAEQAIARGADVIGMAGGDGSQAAVAAVAIRHDVPFVVVPAGTRNHFALDLGLDRDDVVGALDAFRDGVERVVDIATVNGRVFVNNVSAGLYAAVVQSPEYRDARARTVLEMLPDLIGPDTVPPDLRFIDEDGTDHRTAHVILVSNNPYDLHVLAGRGTRERLDAGVLGIAAIWIASASEAGRYVALEAAGRGARFPGLREWSARTFRVDSDGPVKIGIDGETLELDPPLLFESRPRALRVRLPRHAIGRSPTARAVHLVSHSTLARLARVALGKPVYPDGRKTSTAP